ncbi:MAG: type II toxin-antitoxin system HicA family toxin [Chloroflexi bacterium]|nr:type II toxin-antitoxin system HicA family toxin [Chloroflexota bacterium]
MSKREKLRRKLRNNPEGATMQEVETLLTRFGFTLARVSGSHHIYEYEQGEVWKQVVVPLHGQKVKKVYVKQVVTTIDELFPDEDDEDEIPE